MNSNSNGTTKKVTPRQNGAHPDNNLQLRDCMCPNPTECRELMWEWADINATHMFPYPILPQKTSKDTATARHLQGYRENVVHHFYGHASGELKKDTLDDTKTFRFALWHLPPAFRPFVNTKGPKLQRWRIPFDVGKELLTDRDLCKSLDEDGKKTYYASPICHDISEAKKEVAVAEREYHATLKSPPESNSTTTTARTTPNERRIAQATRQAKLDPNSSGQRVVELEDKLAALELRLQEQEEVSEQREIALRAVCQAEKEDLILRLKQTGMSRMSLCNDKYHEDKPWLAPHLYGSTWQEHKAIGDGLFAGKNVKHLLDRDNGYLREQLPGFVVDNWNVSVSGEGTITPFERYSICCMIARRDFPQETIAGMYGTHQSTISRIFTTWMPILAKAAKNMSELDMEMNHNLFDVEFCEQHNLPYMKDGKAHGLAPFLPVGHELLASLSRVSLED